MEEDAPGRRVLDDEQRGTLRMVVWSLAAWPVLVAAFLQLLTGEMGSHAAPAFLLLTGFAFVGNVIYSLVGVVDGILRPDRRLWPILEPVAIPLVTWSLAVLLMIA